MKKAFDFIRISIIFAAVFVFASCRNQLSFTLLDDDSISFCAECNFDQSGAIQKLLQSVGTDFSELNLDELKSGLEEEGFTKVQVYPSKTEGLVIKGIVPEDNDFVFLQLADGFQSHIRLGHFPHLNGSMYSRRHSC